MNSSKTTRNDGKLRHVFGTNRLSPPISVNLILNLFINHPRSPHQLTSFAVIFGLIRNIKHRWRKKCTISFSTNKLQMNKTIDERLLGNTSLQLWCLWDSFPFFACSFYGEGDAVFPSEENITKFYWSTSKESVFFGYFFCCCCSFLG